MINYPYQSLFLQDSVDKQLSITGSEINITNSDMDSENFELEEILCDGSDIDFGQCNSSHIEFTVGYYEKSIEGEELTVTTNPNAVDIPFQFGKYTVISDKPTADRKKKKIVAYDKLYFVLTKDVTDWYNSILPSANSSVTLKQFRDSFFSMLSITQTSVVLPNDSMTVGKTLENNGITGKQILHAICEINGCFGRIGRDGNFQYVFLELPGTGLFPSNTLYPADDLYPQEYGFEHNKFAENGTYISCEYEDFLTTAIDKLQILTANDDIGTTVGSGNNAYIIQNNFLVFNKTSSELTTIADNIFSKISGIWFRPAEIKAVGNPCIECGDGLRLKTTDGKDIDTYMLSRTLKGVQALKDSISAQSLKTRENDPNSLQAQINQTQGSVRQVKADLIEAKTIIAEEIQVERAKIDDLTAIAITTENLSAQTISASQITTGTLNCANLTVTNLSASSINSGQMSVDRLTDIYGGSAQSRWYEITYASSGYITMHDYVSVRNGSNTGTEQVPTTAQLHLTTQRLYVLKGSPLNP